MDSLKGDIESFLERIPGDALSAREERRLHVFRHATGDVERVGDQAVNIAERGLHVLCRGHVFSSAAAGDLTTLFDKTMFLYELALEALREEDKDRAQEALHREAEVDHLERLFRDRHLQRLDEGVCDAAAGVLFVKILHNLERIGDHAVNIAGDVLYAL